MPIQVQGPDGQLFEFPDGTPQETMKAAMQKRYGQPSGDGLPPRIDYGSSGGLASEAKPPAVQQRTMAERYAAAGIDPQAFDPTEGNSFLQNAAIGLGKSIYDTGRGLQQAVGMRSKEQIEEDRRIDAPLMRTVGGNVGNIAGQALQIAAPLPGAGAAKLASVAGRAAPYVGAAGRAGAFGATQGVGEGETRAGNAATSAALGAAGQGIASGLGALARSARNRLPESVRDSINMARQAGIPLHLSQVTDSRFLKGVGSVVNNLPFTGAAKAARKQQEAFNRAVGRSFGAEDASQLSDEAMQAARARIGAVYDDIYSRNNVALDEKALAKLADLERSASRNLPANEAAVVKNQIDDIIAATQNGAMPGALYQSFRTDRLLPMEGGARTFQSGLIREIRRTLDEAAERSVGPQDAKALAIARRQYRNMKTAEKALAQVAGSKGDVRPAALWPIVNQARGATPEMRELAKIGQNVLKDPIPNSGTPERDLILRLLGLGGAGSLGGVGLPALAKIAGTGIAAGRVMNSPLAARALGQGRPMSALAGLARPAPRLLPAAAPPLSIDVGGGRVATPEEMARDAEIVRRFREQQLANLPE